MTDENKKPDRTWAKLVWKVVCDIPPGHVLTYGEVARLSGMSSAARRVSQAMSWAPRNLNVPWHRVINSQGKISIPKDSPWHEMQKSRLQEEGVVFLNGKIDLKRFGYKGTVDALLWGHMD
ncbi:MAG: methylated-DNA-protein-cysteine methyltransferase-like protein [Rhodothermales bacterium]|jgi:methylated-DNA-protein-cysteine methyltransferase-like protein